MDGTIRMSSAREWLAKRWRARKSVEAIPVCEILKKLAVRPRETGGALECGRTGGDLPMNQFESLCKSLERRAP